MENFEFKKEMKQNIKKARMLLNAVAHPLRQKIINFIGENQIEVNVTEICFHLEEEQSLISQQLKILRDSNVVLSKRKGKFIYYSLNKKKLEFMNEGISLINQGFQKSYH